MKNIKLQYSNIEPKVILNIEKTLKYLSVKDLQKIESTKCQPGVCPQNLFLQKHSKADSKGMIQQVRRLRRYVRNPIGSS